MRSFDEHDMNDLLERAIVSLREKQVSDNPAAHVVTSTVEALRSAEEEYSWKLARPQTSFVLTWRWIMRSPVSRISAAVVLALAIGGIAVSLHGGGTTPAFGDFLEPLLSEKTVMFKATFENDEGRKTTAKVMAMASAQRLRTEQDLPNKSKMVVISGGSKTLLLFPAQKSAVVTSLTNVLNEKRPRVIFFELRSLLAAVRDLPDWIQESLGEKTIDGQRLVGYRLTGHGMIWDLWGDPKSRMPVRIEVRIPEHPNMKPAIFSDFVLNADLDESLFNLEPPAGYKVQKRTIDASPAQEKDLIETFRRYAQLRGSALPDQLDQVDSWATTRLFQKDWARSHPMKGGSPSEEELQERQNGLLKFTSGLSFAFEELPREADAHYAGKGVKVGAADTPIFWYRPKDAKKYRVIYADLSVREADTAPRVPNAQPVVSASGPKK